MDGLLIFVFFAAIVASVIKKSKKLALNDEKEQDLMTQQMNQARQSQSQTEKQRQVQQVAATKTSGNATSLYSSQKINHAEGKENHVHQHLNNVNPQQKSLAKGNEKDILTRANRNTENYAKDTLHEGSCELHEETGETLSRIEDLMICGYSGNLHFERDFLSEATDMLNRYTMG